MDARGGDNFSYYHYYHIKPKERLAIYKALSEILDDLGRNLQIESQANKTALEFLKRGPHTERQESRFHSTDTP